MNVTHYIGFDVRKKHINFCSKTASGEIRNEGRLSAQRAALQSFKQTEHILTLFP